jgi:hypothetical protein
MSRRSTGILKSSQDTYLSPEARHLIVPIEPRAEPRRRARAPLQHHELLRRQLGAVDVHVLRPQLVRRTFPFTPHDQLHLRCAEKPPEHARPSPQRAPPGLGHWPADALQALAPLRHGAHRPEHALHAVSRAAGEARLLVAAPEAASFSAPVAAAGPAAPPVRRGERAARLAGSSTGPSLPCVGIVVVVLLLILVLVIRGLEEGAAGLGEGDHGRVVARLQRQRLGATVAVAVACGLVVGGGRGELGGVVRGSVVVLDDGGGGIHHSSSPGWRGDGGAGRRVGVRVDGVAEGGRGERANDGEWRRGGGGGGRGRGRQRGERDAGEVERDGARERVGEWRANVLRRERVVAGSSGHGRKRLQRRGEQ